MKNLIYPFTVLLYYVILLCSCTQTASAITIINAISDSTAAASLFERGVQYEAEGKLEKAAESFAQAASIFEQAGHPEGLLKAQSKAIRVFTMTGKYQQAEQVINMLSKVVDAYAVPKNILSDYLYAQAYYLQATDDFLKARATLFDAIRLIEGDTSQIKLLLDQQTTKGNLERIMGFTDDAEATYLAALKTSANYFGKHNKFLASLYNNLGVLLADAEDYFKAEKYYLKANHEAELSNNRRGVAFISANLGNVYFHTGRLDKALKSQQRALKLHQEVHGKSHIEVARAYHNIGIIYEKNEALRQAMESYESALKILKDTGSNRANLLKARILAASSRLLRKQKADTQQIISRDRQACELIARTIGKENSRYLGAVYGLIEAYGHSGTYQKALTLNESILKELLNYQPDLQNPEDLDVTGFDIRNFDLALDALNQRCNILEAVEDTTQISQREIILQVSSMGLRLLDHLKRSNLSLGTKQRLVAQNSAIFGHVLEALWKLDKPYPSFFKVMETYRLNSIQNHLAKTDQNLFLNLPEEIRNKESELKNLINYHQNQILNSDQDSLAILATIFDLRTQLDSVQQQLRTDYPKYYQIHYENTIPDLHVVQNQLNPDESLIMYQLTKKKLYAMIVTSDSSAVLRKELDSTFHGAVEQLKELVTTDPALKKNAQVRFEEFVHHSHLLYQTLILPFEKLLKGKDLIIVPDGTLSTFPFEILLKDDGLHDYNYRSLPYLITNHKISYAISANFMSRWRRDVSENGAANKKAAVSIMALAPFADTGNALYPDSALQPLANSVAEVNQLKKFFAEPLILQGSEATENRLRESFRDNQVIHLASHGLVDSENPLLSRVVLAHDPTDSTFDDYLHVYELYNLEIPNPLTVLSACHSASGTILQGEGVIGLTHGFFYAGAESVLSSLWFVDDLSSTVLMKKFYEGLDAGFDKRTSLRKAKTAFLNDANVIQGHPYYWASFVLSGDERPLKLSRSDFFVFYLIAVLLLTIIVGYFISKRGNKIPLSKI